MDAHQYLAFAESLALSVKDDPTAPNHAAACRSIISRAYYAVFHLVRQLLDDLGLDTRGVPNAHATFEQALNNSGVFTLERIASSLRLLCGKRTTADYDFHNVIVESYPHVEELLGMAKAAILQLDIIRAGKLTPPLDRNATRDAILKWAKDNSKPLWKKV